MQTYKTPLKPEHIWDGKFPPAQTWKGRLTGPDKQGRFSGGSGTEGDPF